MPHDRHPYDHMNREDLAAIATHLGGQDKVYEAVLGITDELRELAAKIKTGEVHLPSEVAEKAVVHMVAINNPQLLSNALAEHGFPRRPGPQKPSRGR